jgi:hypothetical protein
MGYNKKIKVIDDNVISSLENNFENFKFLLGYDSLLFENIDTQRKYIEYEKRCSNK